MIRHESNFGQLLRHWLKANPRYSCAFELKQSKNHSIPFSCLEEHQADYLEAINGPKGALVRVQGTNGEPDYIYLRDFPACVAIRYPNGFVLIGIGTFLLEKSRAKKGKGLTWVRAQEISTVFVHTAKKKAVR